MDRIIKEKKELETRLKHYKLGELLARIDYPFGDNKFNTFVCFGQALVLLDEKDNVNYLKEGFTDTAKQLCAANKTPISEDLIETEFTRIKRILIRC
jgi:hypothetical protein